MNRDDLEVALSLFAVLGLGILIWVVLFILGAGILVYLDRQ